MQECGETFSGEGAGWDPASNPSRDVLRYALTLLLPPPGVTHAP